MSGLAIAVGSGRTSSCTPAGAALRSRVADVLDDGYDEVLSARSWLESKVSEGGMALDRVREQLAHARVELFTAAPIGAPIA